MPSLHVVKGSEINPDISQSAEDLTNQFCYMCGFRRLPWMLEAFSTYLQEGYEPAMVLEVIRRTARAPRPSWAYLEAIMDRCTELKSLPAFLTHRHPQPGDLPY